MWTTVVAWCAARLSWVRAHKKETLIALGAALAVGAVVLFLHERGARQRAETRASVAADAAIEDQHKQQAEVHVEIGREAARMAQDATQEAARAETAAVAERARQDAAAAKREAKVNAAGDDADQLERVMNEAP